MNIERFTPDNRHGWQLDVKRYSDPGRLVPGRRPIVMVPGYCMNTFILGFHPRGRSMVEHLVHEGFEVWTANLRGQGGSLRQGGSENYGFQDLSLVDIPRVRDLVLEHSASAQTGAIDVVGCSLGATMLYAYLAHNPRNHGIGSMVAIGGPLRWHRVHPLVRVVFGSPAVAGSLKVRGTRELARLALPVAQRVPALLSLYLNPKQCDLSQIDQLIQTIDDPNAHLNRQIAHWLRQRDLVVAGTNISQALGQVDVSLMCILANQDGVVPPESALSVIDHIGTREVEILKVGTPRTPYAHADLFISDEAEQRVFGPLGRFLASRY